MLWIPRFDFTLYLGIICTLFDIGYLYTIYHFNILGLTLLILLFVLLCFSKIPIFIIAETHFNRRLIWLGCISVALSILLVITTDTLMFIFGHIFLFHPIALVACFSSPLVLFFHCWLFGNMLILRVLLIRDVTLPSKLSMLEMKQKADEYGEYLTYL
ncbi:hypothetical protein PAEPH01_1440 [Pancytospora epiphaga]|nr:hypothetical protein PAEPH01_1440 [Pancytospora epiphaga]